MQSFSALRNADPASPPSPKDPESPLTRRRPQSDLMSRGAGQNDFEVRFALGTLLTSTQNKNRAKISTGPLGDFISSRLANKPAVFNVHQPQPEFPFNYAAAQEARDKAEAERQAEVKRIEEIDAEIEAQRACDEMAKKEAAHAAALARLNTPLTRIQTQNLYNTPEKDRRVTQETFDTTESFGHKFHADGRPIPPPADSGSGFSPTDMRGMPSGGWTPSAFITRNQGHNSFGPPLESVQEDRTARVETVEDVSCLDFLF